jgi:predicted PurR-regulated permease PerM
MPPDEAPRMSLPSPEQRAALRRQRAFYTLAGIIATLVLLHIFSGVLLPFVLAATLAYLLDPLATRLRNIGVPRGLSAFVLLLAVIAIVFAFLLLIYPLLTAQFFLLLQRIPDIVAALRDLFRDALIALADALGEEFVDARLRELAGRQITSLVGWITGTVGALIGGGAQLVSIVTVLVVTPIVAFYLLRDWPLILLRVESWVPLRNLGTVRRLAREIDQVLSAWVRGQILVCLLLGTYYAVALTLAGLELGLIVGMTAGLISFIPYVGTLVGGLLAVGLAAVQFGAWREIGLIAAVFMIGNLVEGYVIYPRIIGERVSLHAVWVIFALLAGGVVAGFLGVLLAVPAAAAIGVLARFWLARYRDSAFFRDPHHH